jgi:phage-related protein
MASGSEFLGSAYAEIDIRTGNFSKGISNLQSQLKTFQANSGQAIEKVVGGLDGLADATIKYGALAGVALGAAGVAWTKFATKTAGEYEMNRIAFETMLGSGERAATLMKKLSDFAATTPFELPQVVAAAKQLLAFGYTADEIIPTLRRMGDVAAALNIPIGDMAYLFGTMKTQGRAFSRDILQFTMRGIPMVDELARVLKVSKNQVMDLVSEGKVGFEEVNQALINMTSSGSKFGGLMDKQSKTLPGIWSNIKDNMSRIALAFMGMDLGGDIEKNSAYNKMKTAAESLLNYLNENRNAIAKTLQGWAASIINVIEKIFKLITAFNDLSPSVKSAIGTVVKLTGVFLLLNVVVMKLLKPVGKLWNLGTSLGWVAKSAKGLSGVPAVIEAMGTGLTTLGGGSIVAGLGWLALIIAAIVVAVIGMKKAWEANFGGIRDITLDAVNKLKGAWDNLVGAFQELYSALDKALAPLGGMKGVMDALGKAIDFVLKLIGSAIWLAFANTIKRISDIIQFLADYVNKLADMIDSARKEINKMIEEGTKRWEDFRKAIGEVANELSNNFQSSMKSAGTAIEGIKKKINDFYNEKKKQAFEFFPKDFSNQELAKFDTNLKALAKGMEDTIKSKFREVGKEMLTVLMAPFAINLDISKPINAIGKWVDGIVAWLPEKVNQMSKAINDFFTVTVPTIITTDIPNAVKNMGTWFDNVKASIGTKLTEWKSSIQAWFNNLFTTEDDKKSTDTAGKNISSSLGQGIDKDKVNLLWSIAKTIGYILLLLPIVLAASLLAAGVDLIWNIIRGIGSAMGSMWAKGSEAVWNFIRGIWGGLGSAWSAGRTAISNAISGIASGIGEAWSWGAHLIENFISGIRSRLGGIGSAVSGVKDTVRRWLGFSKNKYMPTEVWGAHLVENFALGMKNAMPALTAQMTALQGTVSAGSLTAVAEGTVIDQSTRNEKYVVNIGMYAGTETEKRAIAVELDQARQKAQKITGGI